MLYQSKIICQHYKIESGHGVLQQGLGAESTESTLPYHCTGRLQMLSMLQLLACTGTHNLYQLQCCLSRLQSLYRPSRPPLLCWFSRPKLLCWPFLGTGLHAGSTALWPSWHSPGRYVSIIQSNIESGPKMIQFNIQFKTKFEIFI